MDLIVNEFYKICWLSKVYEWLLFKVFVYLQQDDITGDGTTSNVLIIGELLKQADRYVSEGLHPRLATEGFEMAKKKALEVFICLFLSIWS